MSTKRRIFTWVPPLAFGVVLVLSAGCGDDTSAPVVADLVITTVSTGADIDADGYTVTVGNTLSQNVGASGSTTFANLSTGDYNVELSGLADNCAVDGMNPRTVNVSNDGGATTFNVVCNSLTGSIESITSTTGVTLDADGYTLEIDGVDEGPIGVNDTVTVDDLDVGDHTVELLDLAPNCSVTGGNPLTVTIPDDVADVGGGTVSATFAVNCVQALGDLIVWTNTTGANLDPDGYTVTVDGSTSQAVATNGNVTFPNLDVGIHSVELTGMATNCNVVGDNPMDVDVQFGATADTFDIACESVGRIVFDSDGPGNREIYVFDGDGSNPSRLTNDPAADRMPVFSPDNTMIAFSSDRSGRNDIWVMNADGTSPVQLTTQWSNREPAWSPDGLSIIWTRDRSDVLDVWIMDADGTNQTNITQSDTSMDDQAEWSPDGTQIVFRSDRGGTSNVYVMNVDGTGVTQLTTTNGNLPTWSPDGTKIAYVSGDSGNLDIWVMNADGTNPVNLTNNAADDGWPAWSTTGSEIVFSSDRTGTFDLWVMRADGTGLTRLTDESGTDLWPNWGN